MELTLPSGRVIADVTGDVVQSAIEGEDFATLGIDPHYYIPCEKQKAPCLEYALEHQDGTIAERYQAVDGPITLDRVRSAFIK